MPSGFVTPAGSVANVTAGVGGHAAAAGAGGAAARPGVGAGSGERDGEEQECDDSTEEPHDATSLFTVWAAPKTPAARRAAIRPGVYPRRSPRIASVCSPSRGAGAGRGGAPAGFPGGGAPPRPPPPGGPASPDQLGAR